MTRLHLSGTEAHDIGRLRMWPILALVVTLVLIFLNPLLMVEEK